MITTCSLCRKQTGEKIFMMPDNHAYQICQSCRNHEPLKIFQLLWQKYLEPRIRTQSRNRVWQEVTNEYGWLPPETYELLLRSIKDGYISSEEIEGFCFANLEFAAPPYAEEVRNVVGEKLKQSAVVILPAAIKETLRTILRKINQWPDCLFELMEITQEGISWKIPEVTRNKSQEKLHASIQKPETILDFLTVEEGLPRYNCGFDKSSPISQEQERIAKELLGEMYPYFYTIRHSHNDQRKQAMEKLVELNEGLVKKIANKYYYATFRDPAIDFEDLSQEAYIGLLYSIENFDYSLGLKFSSYAWPCIAGFVQRSLGSIALVPHNKYEKIQKLKKIYEQLDLELGGNPNLEEIAHAMKLSIEQVQELLVAWRITDHHYIWLDSLTDKTNYGDSKVDWQVIIPSPSPGPMEGLLTEELKQRINEIISLSPLKGTTKFCLRYYYGLSGFTRHTLEETAEVLDLTRQRVYQLVDKAIKHFKKTKKVRRKRQFLNDNEFLQPIDSLEILRQATLNPSLKIDQFLTDQTAQHLFNSGLLPVLALAQRKGGIAHAF